MRTIWVNYAEYSFAQKVHMIPQFESVDNSAFAMERLSRNRLSILNKEEYDSKLKLVTSD